MAKQIIIDDVTLTPTYFNLNFSQKTDSFGVPISPMYIQSVTVFIPYANKSVFSEWAAAHSEKKNITLKVVNQGNGEAVHCEIKLTDTYLTSYRIETSESESQLCEVIEFRPTKVNVDDAEFSNVQAR